jgi:hypothetical protein
VGVDQGSHSGNGVVRGNSARTAALSPPDSPSQPAQTGMLFEIGKALSFMLSILSLFPLVVSAFFEPGTHWEDRLTMSLLRIALAGCVCFASGLFFYRPARPGEDPGEPLMQTLPVRIFFWTVGGVALMFLISWYLEQYFVPLLWRNQPYEMNFIPRTFLRLG